MSDDIGPAFRQIIVRCCVQCPYCDRNSYSGAPITYRCEAVRTKESIQDAKTIPEWCPLPALHVTLSGRLVHSDEAYEAAIRG